MANVFKGKLDIKNVKPNFNPIFVQYDHARLEIEMLDNKRSYDLTNVTRVEFTHVLRDETVITHPGQIVTNGNKKIIRYEYQGSEMDLIGYVDASFAIFDANNKKVSSHSFTVEIKKDLRDEHFNPAQPNYGLLQTLINDVEDLKLNGGGSGGGRGPKGDPGYTPIKGVDYFDGRDGRDGIDGKDGRDGVNGRDGYTPIKGVDYFDGKDGKDGVDGSPGRDGIDGEKGDPFTYEDFTPTQLESLRGPQGPQGDPGYTPIKGVDYFDGENGEVDVSTILIPMSEGETDTNYIVIPFDWMDGDTRYRDINNGGLASGTNWKTNVGELNYVPGNVYKFLHPSSTPQVRIICGSPTAFLGTISVYCNEEFTLPNGTTVFAFNAATRNANPPTSINTFDDLASIEQLQLVKVVGEGEGEGGRLVPLVELLNSFERRLTVNDGDDDEERVLKVLMIGNSFSEDVQEYIHNICHSADVKTLFGNMYRPGESLEGHVFQATSNANSYTYHKRSSVGSSPTHQSRGGISLLYALQDEDWDIVCYQQASVLSVDYNSFNPHLGNLISYVNQHKTNANLKHAIHMTWGYSERDDMHPNIVNSYRQAMFDNDIDILIPTGTAIENARTIPHLQELDNDLTEDGTHLGNIGDYIGGLTIFESLLASKYKKDIFQDVNYTVESKYHSYLSKIAVKNAILNPFNITDI